jgi:RNA polymerase sigma factor (sigma-70 family)
MMAAFGLRPMDLMRTANRIAQHLSRPSISRAHLNRFRSDPKVSPSADKMFILVAAFRELTGWLVQAADLFEVEPAIGEGASGRFPSLSPWRTCVIDGSNASVPVSSSLRRSQGWRPPLQDRSTLPGEEAFDALNTQYGVLLRGLAIHRYHIPPDEAEELVHDAFIAWLERNTSVRDAKGWLMGVVRFKCSHYWRERGREAPLGTEHEEAADPGAEGDLRSANARLTVATAIRQLGAECRETIRRFYWLDESLLEIAASYSKSQNTIKQMLFTCRRRIRDLITGKMQLKP